MRAEKELAEGQIDRSVDMCDSSRDLIALTDELVSGSDEAIRSSASAEMPRQASRHAAVRQAALAVSR